MTTVVLGWDGLDHDLLARYGLVDAFGARTKPLETLVNPELGKPHTWELWPSIITGQPPREHGIHADEYIESNWSSPWLRLAARLSEPVPDAIRWRVGRWLRGSGAEMGFESTDYYAARDIPTVFDGRQSVPIAIPNYRSDVDERFAIEHDRGAALAEFMETETAADGSTRRTPSVDPETFAGRIAADCAEKIGLVRHAIAGDADLVFVWLAYLDTAGHVAPTVDQSDEWMRQAYETAADYTQMIRASLADYETLVCLSDHGLQEGEHTETACLGAWPGEAVAGIESVLDVAPMLEEHTPRSGGQADGYGRDESEADVVTERLQNLGYVD